MIERVLDLGRIGAPDGSPETAPDAARRLSAAGGASWSWEPGRDRLSFGGDLAASGLATLGSRCSRETLLERVVRQDRSAIDAALLGSAPIVFGLRTLEGVRSLWRGGWSASERRAEGVLLPDAKAGLDPLTGLLHRAEFLRRATVEAPATAPRPAVFVADFTRFRRLNEALGPERADEVLCILAVRLGLAYPAAALAARIGDDEFAVIDRDDDAGAERLSSILEEPLRVGGLEIHPRVAIGRATCSAGAASEWLRRADLALERAGSGGQEAAPEAAPSGAQSGARSRLALEAEAHGAMVDGGLEPFYQPIVDLEHGHVGGFEALVRWRHPRLGLLHPEEFLNALETTGLMARLGLMMIEAAATQLATWRRDHPEAATLSVNVNITSDEIMRPGMVDDVAEAIARAGLPPGALKLELTESEVMRDPEAAAVVMQALQAVGTAFSIDDFGMGFSSLSYLARLPLKTLKIDRYFVRAMGVNPAAATIVRSVVALGRDLGLQIVAEGVESVAMARALLEMGCHCGQGFQYAHALPAAEAEAYLLASLRQRT